MPILAGPFQLPGDEIEPLLLGGRAALGDGPSIEVTDPSDGRTIGRVSTVTPGAIRGLVEDAKAALARSGWTALLPHERARMLARAADVIEARADILAELQMMENGKTRKESRAQALSASGIFRYYAAVCECSEDHMPPARGNYISMTVYEPYGVVAALTPWNSPLTMAAQKLAPALASGNAVVLKAAETTTFVTLALAQCLVEAGLPEGLLTVISGGGDVGRALVEDKGINLISFTGGTSTGQAIARGAAERLVPMILELGGKSPHIVCADGDLPKAARGVANGIFGGSGQSCVAGSRLFVDEAVAEEFTHLLIAEAGKMKAGSPRDEKSVIGPLSSFGHRARVEDFVASGRADGGQILTGGARPQGPEFDKGAYYLPTIIAGLAPTARAVREEIFGPILCLLTFREEDELVGLANDSDFGLAAGIWTADYRRAWRIARLLEAGTVWINTYKELSIAAPFGGFKLSGLGREKGIQGMRAYQQAKSLYWAL
jgi:betaine-aldehyde dehydrogenase